ncbi:hypothetical protein BGW42_005941 [Actinomortierella wolfii]|nr:hypothetical protein BGW42_005941 [Actinomortierella wolfii]
MLHKLLMQPKQSILVLGNLLGSGAFGSVYEARWGCQQCAAKMFFRTQSDLYEREIQKEITVLQKLRHRNIIQFCRMHKQDGRIYLLMELAEKGTLAKAINNGLLDWSKKIQLAHEIARGLEYIHQEKVLHRDLKSANVLLTRHMEAKLADFGLARIRSTMSSLSMPSVGGRITGTFGWIAPELFETDTPSYSTKTDVYALGVVMWEMAANCTRPYKDMDSGALIVHHIKSGGLESGNGGDIGSLSDTFIGGEIDHADKKDKLVAVEHSNKDTTSGRLPQIDDDVVRYFCMEAQQGNGDAQLFLGWIYRQEGEFIKNVENSVGWYRKAAERRNVTAQLILGEIYENGEGVDASDVEAAAWYHKAAVHGVAKAQVKLGGMYEECRGVQQDDVEAARWYLIAADQGQDDAQVKIGTWYSLGRGVDQSDVEAVKWFTMAAEKGNADAQNSLAWAFQEGQGIEQSDGEAVK